MNNQKLLIMQKPLFIPLKKKYFEQFEAGTKTIEYRHYGPRWNEHTCTVGREVTLSLGYGKQRRLYGIIKSFNIEAAIKSKAKYDFFMVYGMHPTWIVAEIEIDLPQIKKHEHKLKMIDRIGNAGFFECTECNYGEVKEISKILTFKYQNNE